MGNINFFDLADIKEKINAKYFVETGTYEGRGVGFASQFGFEKCYSIEVDPKFVMIAKNNLRGIENIEIIQGASNEVLEPISDNLNGNTVFWLDAHFPFSYDNILNEMAHGQKDTFAPLEREIKALSKRKTFFKDVILIDDMRCYMNLEGVVGFDEHFASLGQPHLNRQRLIGTDEKFIYEAFSDTHNIKTFGVHEGYLACIPKNI